MILSVVGARPNFIKLAPMVRALHAAGMEHKVIHTGQHYDRAMSSGLFEDLEIPAPDWNLGATSERLGEATERAASIISDMAPKVVLVYGDTHAALVGATAAATVGVPIAHIEAGLRSGDLTMPEERNRVIVDHLSTLLFTPSVEAVAKVLVEGCSGEYYNVGNVMIDSLCWALARPRGQPWIQAGQYAVVTIHRPENTDDSAVLEQIIEAVSLLAQQMRVIFPVHPRTALALSGFNTGAVELSSPRGYIEMAHLVKGAAVVVTDSGGLQEETSYLDVPCITLRRSTERPITLTLGTNTLVDPRLGASAIVTAVREAAGGERLPTPIPLWDGHAAERIVDVLRQGIAS